MFTKGLPVHITGGMEIHVEELVKGLIKRGHEVTIITTKHPKGLKREEKQNLRIYYVGDKPLKYSKIFYKESLKLFNKLNKSEKFDVVHSQSTAGYALTKFSIKVPFVITMHGIIKNEIKSLLSTKSLRNFAVATYLFLLLKLTSDINKLMFERADKIIAVSNELAEDIKRQYKVPEEKLVVIPNGIDINKFKPIDVKYLKERVRVNNEKVILSVGRIEKQKGYHLLLKILPDILKNHDVKLVIVGTGSYLPILKKMAVKLGISDKVIFTGRVPDEELPKYYNLADIFAFPTLRMEGLPLVIPEAMACEKPVVASRIGGIPTVIEDGKDGFLIKPNDLNDLRDKILMLLEDEKLAKRVGKTARRNVVRRFSVDRMVDDTIKVYEEVLECR